ncbi:RNA-binding protein [Taenia solium]|eukprot:TsM_000738400 transcript=TsM_000738400 gene=TsM_000738400
MVKIFVGNLNPNSKSQDLRKRFELYGKVTECDIVNNYAFVHMESQADAEAAISKLHNSEFDGAKINVELSHGKGGGGGPMRRRFNTRGPRRDFRDDRFSAPPRGPFGRESPRGMGGPGGYPPMRDSRYDGPPTWGGDGYGPYPPRGPSRSYDSYSSGPQGRYSSRDYDRNIRSGSRDGPYGSGYQGPAPEPVPPPRDLPRKPSPPRSRFDNYGSNYSDYGRYRDHGQPSSGPPPPAPRSSEYYDNYGSYGAPSGYDYPPRDYHESDRGGNYSSSSYDYGYYGSRGNRSPPRTGPQYARAVAAKCKPARTCICFVVK